MADDPNELVEIEHPDPKVQGKEPPAVVRRSNFDAVWKGQGFKIVKKEKASG